MAGHSKWANIKHKKDRADKQKGKVFSRIAKEIISAVKLGGTDPKSNPRLRLAMQKAKAANMPNDNVERNIKKASSTDQADYVAQTYELYGHGGVGILVETMTDNKNRTASDMRIATNKRGGSIAEIGSVSYSFERKGVISYPLSYDESALFEAAIEAEACDFAKGDECYFVTTEPTKLFEVKEALEAKNYTAISADNALFPGHMVEVDEETMRANLALIDWLEELDDVDAVYHNMELS